MIKLKLHPGAKKAQLKMLGPEDFIRIPTIRGNKLLYRILAALKEK